MEENAMKYQTDAHLVEASEILGYQFGERFGHSLCATDLNGDGYHDLVVGAPLHGVRNHQVGVLSSWNIICHISFFIKPETINCHEIISSFLSVHRYWSHLCI